MVAVPFKNKANRHYSLHGHGVESELMDQSAAAPGEIRKYLWNVPERVGPGPSDPNCITYAYYSTANYVRVHTHTHTHTDHRDVHTHTHTHHHTPPHTTQPPTHTHNVHSSSAFITLHTGSNEGRSCSGILLAWAYFENLLVLFTVCSRQSQIRSAA